MSLLVFVLVLLAAALHAMWNAVVKGGRDTLLSTILVAGFAALVSLAALPFVSAPAPASWPLLVATMVVHVAYFALVAIAYRIGDMSQTYPLMRGTAPLIVAFVSVVWLGEPLSRPAWLGVGVLCAGILAMAAGSRHDGVRAGVLVALVNALVIATYTLIDGAGVRQAGPPTSYLVWVFLLSGVPLVLWGAVTRPMELRHYVLDHWRLGLIGGIGTVASYGLVLFAMTRAPVAVVAALRETAILFGTAISGFFLGEKVGRARIVAACVIAAGAVILRLA